jgi:translation initiation factor 5B
MSDIPTTIRSPIIAVLGHVDHGKTSLLDAIRGSSVAKKEAGGITQMIGASYISKEDIEETSKSSVLKFPLKIPGLLFIDTPGHEAFTNLRERGGSIADLAILVIDINQGFQPQTIESIKILRHHKTPFIIAANKVDAMDGWKSYKTNSIIESISKQPQRTQEKLDEKLYELVGKLSEYELNSERFDRVSDFKSNVALIPVSAKTNEGLAEVLMLIAGLSQKFLEASLRTEVSGAGKGSIIEVKEERGLGTTIDVILYDGILKKNMEFMFLTNNGAKTTKIRALLEPNVSSNNPNEKFKYVDQVVAAAGVKISAPELEDALPGSPIKVVENLEGDKKEIEEQFKKVIYESNESGVIVRADSFGSVEALLGLLKDAGIQVRDAGVGKITRKDVLRAMDMQEDNRFMRAVLGFNVKVLDEAKTEADEQGVPIIWSNIVYQLIDRYKEWVAEEKEKEKKEALLRMPWPGQIKALSGCCFRVCKPAIFGVEVLGGRIKQKFRLMNSSGTIVGEIKGIQHDKESKEEATRGMQVALSSDEPYFGKDICEGDVLYVYMTPDEIRTWEAKLEMLNSEEKEILETIKRITKKYF